MTPALDPFTTLLDLRSGALDPQRMVTERRLSDMTDYYLDEAVGDALVYRVFHVPVPETNAEVQCCTTVLEPGCVGEEFFMTKGHYHELRDRSEVYLGLGGSGHLLMATEDGRHAVEPIAPGTLSYVPGGWAHRSVNTGDEPLVFFAAYIGDAGHDYATIAERGFPVLIVADGDGGSRVVDNPRYA